jgi:hypothetical protein
MNWAALLSATAEPTRRLRAAVADPAAQQTAWLLDLVAQNARTEFGRRHRFALIKSVEDYRRSVPVLSYEQYARDIEAIADGQPNILTAEPVVAFEETAGTTSGRKLIPYTRAGLADIESAILLWLQGLAEAHPSIVAGKAYWSVSPVGRATRRTRGGVPIGFDSDAGYFSAPAAAALSALAAVPMELGQIKDIAEWRYLTLRILLGRDDLTFVSIWSPTFLGLLLDAIPVLADRLLAAIHDGLAGCNTPLARHCTFDPQPERARLIEHAIVTADVAQIWPRLSLVSAWAHGQARGAFTALRRRMPQVAFDTKGLIATEGIVSISLPGHSYPIPALISAFLEFLDASRRPHLVHELEVGVSYRIVISTRSGLYRYDLGDEVVCRGIEAGIPNLEFLGRCGVVADTVGEKLAEAFIVTCLGDVEGNPILAPVDAPRPHYVILHEAPRFSACLASTIESRLKSNPHYAYARRIGQLGPLRVRAIPGLQGAYHRWRLEQGQKLGDIKPPVLLRTANETAELLALLPKFEMRRTA